MLSTQPFRATEPTDAEKVIAEEITSAILSMTPEGSAYLSMLLKENGIGIEPWQLTGRLNKGDKA